MQRDEEIMAAVLGGRLERLAELYRRYRGPLMGYLVNRGNGREAAEDLLQATFERVIRYRSSYRLGSSFKGWVYTIARNAMHDRWKQEGRLPLYDGGGEAEVMETTPNFQQAWEQKETAGQGRAALAALPDHYREVMELAWKRGMKYAQIAELLGVSEANVKVRMHRGVKMLRQNYAKLEAQ